MRKGILATISALAGAVLGALVGIVTAEQTLGYWNSFTIVAACVGCAIGGALVLVWVPGPGELVQRRDRSIARRP